MAMAKRAAGTTLADLTGPQKAAILMMMVGSEEAARVMTQLSEAEVEALTGQIARLECVPHEAVAGVLEEFDTFSSAMGKFLQSGPDFAREALARAIGPDRASETVARVQASLDPKGFEVLREIDDEQLLSFVKREHAQTVALILANLKPRQAGRILSKLDSEHQTEIVRRVARMENVSPEMIRKVKESLNHLFSNWKRAHSEAAGGVETVAELLNNVDRTSGKRILASLEGDDPELAAGVRSLMLTFEDLLQLTDNDLRQVLKEIDSATLALALKAASEELKAKLFANVSQRAADMLRDEIEFLGPVRLQAVQEAQNQVTEAVLRLDEMGQIALARGGEGDEIIV
jgi:flagellar motor switch protein FliG